MFRRIANVIRAYTSSFVSGAERRDPVELLEGEKENLRKQVGQLNQALAAHAAVCERFMTQIKSLEKQEADCKVQAAFHLRSSNTRLAGEFALKLQNLRQNLQGKRGQLADVEMTYKELTRMREAFITSAQEKMEELRSHLDELKMKQSLADMNDLCGHVMSQIGSSSESLDRLLARVKDEHLRVEGRAWASMESIDSTAIRELQSEREALEDMALLELSAELGVNAEMRNPATAKVALKHQ